MKKSLRIISGILGLIVLSEMGILLWFGQKNVVAFLSFSPRQARMFGTISPIRAQWERRINKVGGTRAYQEFKNEYANKSFSVQHDAAHLMGELLYEKQGGEGFTICDDAFSFGCYHSFLAHAISREGKDIIHSFDTACIKAFGPLGTGCQHGIGHGILEYLGHQNLVQALKTCALTTRVVPLLGCISGVFMEYNVPTIIRADTASQSTRVFNPANPYEPCNTAVPDEFRESCYYELPAWWQQAAGTPEQSEAWCRNIPMRAHREVCFLGVGNVAAFLQGYDVAATLARCAMMPDEEAELFCRAGAAWGFFTQPSKRNIAPMMCKSPRPQETARCLASANLAGDETFPKTP